MKIEKKYADTKVREKRSTDDIEYIVIQSFNNKDTSHYHISDGKVIQILPDSCISNSVNGGKLSDLGVYHGICTKYNSISISVNNHPDEEDIELCKHLIMTLIYRHKIIKNKIIRQTDITGEVSPEIWFDIDKWNSDVIDKIKDMLKD